ncbi:protein kinase family protein [Protofrankia coriariae]|uniref:Serine/threonine protein kinase n=1 Tax=Protofrankia coriariae TaxID=1562887 RepID=A0ABR5F143_9ACTN|nr:protein kinase family protein [Protofrankia coriariae]KLL10436.1 serine/threonine protein kinase [Protofrankia coriariae]
MADPVELMLADLTGRYAGTPAPEAFTRLYADDARFGHVFASLHQRLNEHFSSINDRAKSTRHYWAESSRQMLALIEELDDALGCLKTAGFEVVFADGYRTAIDRCTPWLSPSGGSAVPEDFEQIRLIKFEPVFARPETTARLKARRATPPLKMVGEGSYAIVYSFTDPDYGIRFAVKRAKKDLDERDLHRFKWEFEVLKGLKHPYIVEVYRYDEDRNEYMMEYCDETLRSYIARRNGELRPDARKRIALQFLYGINYIHYKNLLHRDVSLQNVMLKVYGDGAVLVKLSDFGLVKDHASDFTRTSTQMRGTIRDPSLSSFKDYGVPNEVYSLGFVLSYIFTGREALKTTNDEVGRIVQKCAANDTSQRYQRVAELITDVERLVVPATGSPA